MKRWVPWALLIGLALVWNWQNNHHAVQNAALQASRDSLDLALAGSQERERARLRVDSALSQEMAALRRRAGQTGAVADVLRDTLVLVDSSFRTRLADSLRAGFDSLIAQHERLEAMGLAVKADLEQALANADQRLSLRAASLAECQSGLAEAIAQRDRFARVSHPSVIMRVIRAAPTAVLFAAVGYLLH